MHKPLDFSSVIDAVLDGRLRVESSPSEKPWPSARANTEGVVSVVLHRDAAGVVVLFGHLGNRTFLTGAYSSRLLMFCAANHSSLFNFESGRLPEQSVDFVFSLCIAASRGGKVDESGFRFVEGAEGAELLFELKRVALEDAAPTGAAVH